MSLVEHVTNSVTERVIGAAIEVHRHLGPGLLESGYQACLQREFDIRKIPYRRNVPVPFEYKGIRVPKGYVMDFLVAGAVVVEIKSVKRLLPIHTAQLMTYMRLLRVSSGLLLNFNVPTLPKGIRRILL